MQTMLVNLFMYKMEDVMPEEGFAFSEGYFWRFQKYNTLVQEKV